MRIVQLGGISGLQIVSWFWQFGTERKLKKLVLWTVNWLLIFLIRIGLTLGTPLALQTSHLLPVAPIEMLGIFATKLPH